MILPPQGDFVGEFFLYLRQCRAVVRHLAAPCIPRFRHGIDLVEPVGEFLDNVRRRIRGRVGGPPRRQVGVVDALLCERRNFRDARDCVWRSRRQVFSLCRVVPARANKACPTSRNRFVVPTTSDMRGLHCLVGDRRSVQAGRREEERRARLRRRGRNAVCHLVAFGLHRLDEFGDIFRGIFFWLMVRTKLTCASVFTGTRSFTGSNGRFL